MLKVIVENCLLEIENKTKYSLSSHLLNMITDGFSKYNKFFKVIDLKGKITAHISHRCNPTYRKSK